MWQRMTKFKMYENVALISGQREVAYQIKQVLCHDISETSSCCQLACEIQTSVAFFMLFHACPFSLSNIITSLAYTARDPLLFVRSGFQVLSADVCIYSSAEIFILMITNLTELLKSLSIFFIV